MLRTGKEHLESIRDGRVVFIGSERVDDVTRHPAFRNAAHTVAALYDMKADPALRDEMTYEEDGSRHSIYFLRARSRNDLQRRMIGHRRIADFTYGMFGRSPDHVSSFVTGMAMKADELEGSLRASRQSRWPIIVISATMTSTQSMRWSRRRRRVIRSSITGKIFRCRHCASCKKTMTVS